MKHPLLCVLHPVLVFCFVLVTVEGFLKKLIL